jgi:hypothetical protein
MSAAEESTNAKAKPPKVDLGAAIKEKLAAVASTATADELALVKQIIETAKSGKRSVEMFNFTPAVCAIMFLTENGHNRDWIPELTEEYARRMNVRLWKPNNAALGFYVDGHIADGQHRMSACALASGGSAT